MKKIIFTFAILVLVAVFAGHVVAAKPTPEVCKTIQGGTLTDVTGNTITPGYDQWGYNYQARMFNGLYSNYSRPTVPVTEDSLNLMMKWNDAWLSNKSCDGNASLDRHFGYTGYIGSGAWLTNHITGTYKSTKIGTWILSGNFVIPFEYSGSYYNHDIVLTDTNGVLTGSGGYPSGGPYSYSWDITAGAISGDTISYDAVYTGGPDAAGTVWHVTGTIAVDGSVSGTWQDNYLGGNRTGTWTLPAGSAVKEMNLCTVSDFVKIVAVPVGSYHDPLVSTPYGEGMWYDAVDGNEIGPTIWGDFAVIQEVSSDPCNEFNTMNYRSQIRTGLGNWNK